MAKLIIDSENKDAVIQVGCETKVGTAIFTGSLEQCKEEKARLENFHFPFTLKIVE